MASTIKKIAVLTVAATLLTSCGSGQTADTCPVHLNGISIEPYLEIPQSALQIV